MEPEIIKVDRPTLRRVGVILLCFLLGLVGAGIWTIEYFNEAYRQYTQVPDPAVLRELSRKLLLALAIPSLLSVAVVVPVIRDGLMTLQTGRSPPPNSIVLKDTVIVTGRAAAIRGWGKILCGSGVGVLMLAMFCLISVPVWKAAF